MKRELEEPEAAVEGDAKRAATSEEASEEAPPPQVEQAADVAGGAAPPPLVTGDSGSVLAAIIHANPSLVDGPASMLAEDPVQSDVLFKLELHSDAVLAVFGYEGLTITTIRERTSCRMRLLPQGTDPDHRSFEVSGAQEAALSACGLILAEMQKSCAANTNVCTPSPGGGQYAIKLLVRSHPDPDLPTPNPEPRPPPLADACGSRLFPISSHLPSHRPVSTLSVSSDPISSRLIPSHPV
jgi:hypothetical protein